MCHLGSRSAARADRSRRLPSGANPPLASSKASPYPRGSLRAAPSLSPRPVSSAARRLCSTSPPITRTWPSAPTSATWGPSLRPPERPSPTASTTTRPLPGARTCPLRSSYMRRRMGGHDTPCPRIDCRVSFGVAQTRDGRPCKTDSYHSTDSEWSPSSRPDFPPASPCGNREFWADVPHRNRDHRPTVRCVVYIHPFPTTSRTRKGGFSAQRDMSSCSGR